MPPIVAINSVQDLYKILTTKRVIGRRAGEELLTIAGDRMLKNTTDPSEEETRQFMQEECLLLQKYANYPTLTEWNNMPGLRHGTKWGSTFGVTILVGELILQQVHHAHKGFPTSVLQKMLFAMLAELDHPSANTLVEPFEKMINFKIEREDGRDMSPEERAGFLRRILGQILASFVHVMDRYGLVESDGEGGASITLLGNRVLLHLKDAREIVDVLAGAHARFQSEIPNLSVTSN